VADVKRIYQLAAGLRGKRRRIFDADEFATTRRISLVVIGLAGDIHWDSSGGRSDTQQVCSSLGHWGLKKWRTHHGALGISSKPRRSRGSRRRRRRSSSRSSIRRRSRQHYGSCRRPRHNPCVS
jgi:hypothetical protein